MKSWMTVLGDLHGRTPAIRPDSAALLIAGDICPDGGLDAQWRFLDGPFRAWATKLAIPVIAVAGNHDHLVASGTLPADLPFTLLEVSGTELNGLKVWGMPWVLGPHQAFGVNEEEMERRCELIPDDTDILITHNPPAGLGCGNGTHDHLGSVALRYWIWKHKPQLHIFGHVHEGRGHWRIDGTYYINCTLGNGNGARPRFEPWGLAGNSWRREAACA